MASNSHDQRDRSSSDPSQADEPAVVEVPSQPDNSPLRLLLIFLVPVVFVAGFVWGMRSEAYRHTPAYVSQAATSLVPSTRPAEGASIAGEFEPQEALLLGVDELVRHDPDVLQQLIPAIAGRVRIIGLVRDLSQREQCLRLLDEIGLPPETIEFLVSNVSGMWVRDYGPIFIRGQDGEPMVLDSDYLQEAGLEADDRLPLLFGQQYQMPVVHVPLTLEGGNLLSNGRRTCLTTDWLLKMNLGRGYDEADIAEILQNYFGFEHWVHLQPLVGERTGHIDMFATLIAPDHVVVGEMSHAENPVNAKILDANAARLAAVVTSTGPMRVSRIVMPSVRDTLWRTYTNVIFANGVLLVPQYPNFSEELDRAALETYRHLLPDWQVVGIDASDLIVKRGSLHCIAISVPKFTPSGQRAEQASSGAPASDGDKRGEP